MATTGLRIGIIGRGPAARDHADRLAATDGVSIVGCADVDLASAQALASSLPAPAGPVPAFEGHLELLRVTAPDALVLVSPDRSHYRAAMDGLQAGCHLLLATPLSTSVQEAVDIVGLARARDRLVCVEHVFRRFPSLIRARTMLAEGAIGRPHLVTSTLGATWTSDATQVPGGVLTGLGVDWVDAVLWTSGRPAELVAAVQATEGDGRDLVTAASIRLAGGMLASVAISGATHPPLDLELTFLGETGKLRATADSLVLEERGGEPRPIPLAGAGSDVIADFVAEARGEPSGCCPAAEAIDAVRVLEAIARSAAIGQFVGLA